MESKIKTNGLLSDPLILMLLRQVCQFSMLLYNIVDEVLPNFLNANKRIEGIQIGDDWIEMENFTNNTTISLRGITCFNRV